MDPTFHPVQVDVTHGEVTTRLVSEDKYDLALSQSCFHRQDEIETLKLSSAQVFLCFSTSIEGVERVV